MSPVFKMVLIAVLSLAVTVGISIFLARMTVKRMRGDRPPQTVVATVVAKRGHTSRNAYCKTCAVQPEEMSTTYYATFQFESGDRLELRVPSHVIGYLIEGDRGMLTFQGHVFLRFERA